MTDLCRNCCKMLCPNKDNPEITMCDKKVTFLEAGIIDTPKIIKGEIKKQWK